MESPSLCFLSGLGVLGIPFLWVCSKLLATCWYMFFNASREIIFSLVSKYLTVGVKSTFMEQWDPYQTKGKMGLSFECSFYKKLYAVQADGITLFHSKDFDTCLDIHALNKLWNLQFFHWIGDDNEGNRLYIPPLTGQLHQWTTPF